MLVTLAAGQRLTGAAMLPIGVASGGTATTVDIDLCYQLASGTTIVNFGGGHWTDATLLPGAITAQSVAGTVVPGTAGAYYVGACVRNATAALNNNDWVNGWVMVTN
jgi:hypothetical protein